MILSQEDIEMIADGIIEDFKEVTGIDTIFTPIDQLATNYLNLEVTFEKLSNDGNFCGVTAYEETSLTVNLGTTIKQIPIRKNQIILDSAFIHGNKIKKLCGKRRFTLAHEVAHQILFQLANEDEKEHYKNAYFSRKMHSARSLKTSVDWNEWQANALGAALLMPRGSVYIFMSIFKDALDSTQIYTNIDMSYCIEIFSEYFDVSKKAAYIRLKQLGYISSNSQEVAYA